MKNFFKTQPTIIYRRLNFSILKNLTFLGCCDKLPPESRSATSHPSLRFFKSCAFEKIALSDGLYISSGTSRLVRAEVCLRIWRAFAVCFFSVQKLLKKKE